MIKVIRLYDKFSQKRHGRNKYKILIENLKGRKHVGDLGMDGKIISR
jgi:hypothetical protein